MYKRYKNKETSKKEYCDWWAQQKGFRDYGEYCKNYKDLNRQQVLEMKRKYRQQNKEEVYIQQKDWYIRHPEHKEHKKQYYQNNKKQISRRSKEYRQDNREKITKQKKEYRLNNREKISEHRRQYYKTSVGKTTINRSISKRKRNFGYNVLNPQDATNPEYVGHHINNIDVLFIPEELHKYIQHSVVNNVNIDKINTICSIWCYFQKYYY